MKKTLAILLALVLALSTISVIPASAQSKAEQYLETMSTEDKISQMIMPAFRYSYDSENNRSNVTAITDDIAATIGKHSYSGVILFGQNTPTNENTVRLVDALQKANAVNSRPRLLITIDQEGGWAGSSPLWASTRTSRPTLT